MAHFAETLSTCRPLCLPTSIKIVWSLHLNLLSTFRYSKVRSLVKKVSSLKLDLNSLYVRNLPLRSDFTLVKETSECQNFLKSAADSFFNFLHTSFSEKLEGLFQIDDKPSRFNVVLTVFNQVDKSSGRDVISRNAFLTKVL